MANVQKVNAEIKRVVTVTEDVFRLDMTVVASRNRFEPGQFLHFTLDEYDPRGGFWPESRVFSIASAPGSSELSIIFSVKGSYTKRMRDEVQVGSRVWIKYPFGDFVIPRIVHEKEASSLALIAGGTGVAPFLPYLAAQSVVSDKETILYYGVRNPDHCIDLPFLSSLLTKDSNFLLDISIESKNARLFEHERYRQREGRLNVDTILDGIKKPHEALFFLSGPPVMINSLRTGFEKNGILSDRIIIDNWE